MSIVQWYEAGSENQRHTYRRADKSLARPGKKQTTATKDVDIHISYLYS
jgi:hypothetical protein